MFLTAIRMGKMKSPSGRDFSRMPESLNGTGIPERIDLHMHTTVSDGSDTPQEILEKAIRFGLQMFSVTDHDAIDGAVKIARLIADRKESIFFIKGIEFSCKDSQGKYHILGYRYDETAEELLNIVKKAHDLRLSKVYDRLEFIKKEFGFTFRDEDMKALFLNSNPGKPHIAKMMIRYGYASSIPDAMKNYLNKKKFSHQNLTPEEAINAIRRSGGIPVLAHPAYGDGGQLITGSEMDARVRRLISFGLMGLECYYSGFTPKLMGEMLALADRYDLFATAGSDYHGTTKLVGFGETNLPLVSEGSPRVRSFIETVRQ